MPLGWLVYFGSAFCHLEDQKEVLVINHQSLVSNEYFKFRYFIVSNFGSFSG